MPIVWSPRNLTGIIFLALILLIFTFSRRAAIKEGIVIALAGHYVVISSLLCNYLFMTTVFEDDEIVFDFSFTPFYPALSFYSGIGIFIITICVGIRPFLDSQRHQYKTRQLIAFALLSGLMLFAVFGALRTPIAAQSALDAFEATRELP